MCREFQVFEGTDEEGYEGRERDSFESTGEIDRYHPREGSRRKQ